MEKYYVENMEEYPLLYILLGLEKFQDLSLYIGFGTWKNSEPSLLAKALGLEKIPRSLKARLERHATRSLFFGLANKS